MKFLLTFGTLSRNVKTSKDTSLRGRKSGGKSDRGRGGKTAGGRGSNLIQTTGVFSEGAGDGALKKSLSFRSSYADDSPSPSQMRRPTINKNLDNKIDVKEEAQNLRDFLGDSDEDFDYQKTDLDSSIPIKLSNGKWNRICFCNFVLSCSLDYICILFLSLFPCIRKVEKKVANQG